jgi:hypothetical protein
MKVCDPLTGEFRHRTFSTKHGIKLHREAIGKRSIGGRAALKVYGFIYGRESEA